MTQKTNTATTKQWKKLKGVEGRTTCIRIMSRSVLYARRQGNFHFIVQELKFLLWNMIFFISDNHQQVLHKLNLTNFIVHVIYESSVYTSDSPQIL